MFDPGSHIDALQSNAGVFREIVSGHTADVLHWRQAPEKWNLTEIICHLYDEEREDFRARLRSVLEDPDKPFDPIDPAGWVNARDYAARDAGAMLQAFLQERALSVDWLRSLANANWDNTYQHPRIGPMSAAFILANWVAHDYLHIRQILKLKYDYLKQQNGISLEYAGDW